MRSRTPVRRRFPTTVSRRDRRRTPRFCSLWWTRFELSSSRLRPRRGGFSNRFARLRWRASAPSLPRVVPRQKVREVRLQCRWYTDRRCRRRRRVHLTDHGVPLLPEPACAASGGAPRDCRHVDASGESTAGPSGATRCRRPQLQRHDPRNRGAAANDAPPLARDGPWRARSHIRRRWGAQTRQETGLRDGLVGASAPLQRRALEASPWIAFGERRADARRGERKVRESRAPAS